MLNINFWRALYATLTYTDSNPEAKLIDTTGVETSNTVSIIYPYNSCQKRNQGITGTGCPEGLYRISNGTTVYWGNGESSSYDLNGGVWLGTGTTAATLNDYCLSGDRITSFIASTVIKSSLLNYTGVYIITNTGTESFTIGEVGLFGYDGVMLDRTVLTAPLTIASGESKILNYTISLTGSSANGGEV